MFITLGIFPDEVKAVEHKIGTSPRTVLLRLDGDQTVYLTLDQARGLWHELGAVLQSEDKAIEERAGGTVQEMYPNA